MLLAAVALTVATGDYADAVVICVVVLFNTTVGVVQEVRADNAVTALSAMTAPAARVLRGGTEQEVTSSAVVPGDVLVLGEGDIVPADAALTQAAALLIDESALTGESVPVDKDVHERIRTRDNYRREPSYCVAALSPPSPPPGRAAPSA